MSNTPNRLAGTAYVTVDGVPQQLIGSLEYSSATVTRETESGQDGVHGFSEKPKPSYIAGTFRDNGKVSLEQINAMDNVTVDVRLNNGKRVIGRNMWTVGELTSKTEKGEIEIRWEGKQGAVKET